MIEVFDPVIGEEEIEAVVAALRRGEISGSFGESIPRFEEEFAAYCGCKYGVAVSSGSTALHLAVAAAGIGAGDEVLVSSSTNIATALAVIHNGAIPVPVDSENVTWNLDLDLIENLITEKTKAIIPVHLYGHPVDMDRLMEIARRHKLLVIEDCAESHGATCRGRMTGSFGDMACFSFYANKVITTGEGGMVTTNNEQFAERLRLLRNLAFTKRRLAHTYNQLLGDIDGLQLPHEAEWAKNVYWMYAVVVQPEFGIRRDELMTSLRAADIDTRTFFCPMNQQPCLLSLHEFRAVPCPVADGLWDNGLYLPSTYSLSEDVIKQ